MARRRRVEEHENHERWLVSYADFITLLFAFFVVMYSISSVNEGKYRVLSETFEAVFTEAARTMDPIQVGELSRGEGEKSPTPGKPDSPSYDIELPNTPYMPPSAEEIKTINDLTEQFQSALSDLIEQENVIIKKGDDWLEVEMKSNVLFQSGDARLERSAVPIIGKVAEILNTSANPVQVEGFTDNQPIQTSRFPSNWELSAARAASVVHLLDRYGIDPDRMSAIGYGQYKPIADNSTELGRQKNRRVVLVVLGRDKSRRDLDQFVPDKTTETTVPVTESDENAETPTPVTLPNVGADS